MNNLANQLQTAVMLDCSRDKNCFNPKGCDKTDACTHKYCDKYAWVLERAKHYAETLGINYEHILASWEEKRTYWYMNYYNEFDQPLLNDKSKVMLHEAWVAEGERRFGNDRDNWRFKCAKCGNVQTQGQFVALGIDGYKAMTSCIGRFVKNSGGCDWTLGEFLQIHNLTVVLNGVPYKVFEFANELPEVQNGS